MSFIAYQIKKSVAQRIMVKTTSRSDCPWSAIFCVIVYSVLGSFLFSECVFFHASFEHGKLEGSLKPTASKSREFPRLSRDLRFVSKICCLFGFAHCGARIPTWQMNSSAEFVQ